MALTTRMLVEDFIGGRKLGDVSFNDSFEIGEGGLTSPLLPGFELDVAGVFPRDETS